MSEFRIWGERSIVINSSTRRASRRVTLAPERDQVALGFPEARQAVLQREQILPSYTQRLWFPKFLFAGSRPGVLLHAKDWIKLTKHIENARTQWRLQRLSEEGTTKRDESEPIIFDTFVGDEKNWPKVLLIEENSSRQQQVKRLLDSQFTIYTVQDGIEGLQAARKHQPDLILMPTNPAKMTGAAMIQALRSNKQLRDTPLILMVGQNEMEAAIDEIAERLIA